jgi:pyridinium-3,5-bisthiocarboxylic acid mononucleotide nickel chelatase
MKGLHLHVDCASGAAGDMMLGALIHLGVSVDAVGDALDAIGAGRARLHVDRVVKGGIAAVDIKVDVGTPGHGHHHYGAIRERIVAAALTDGTKARALDIFDRLARAEAKLHGTTVERVEFHEVGAIDSIVDVVGTAAALDQLAPKSISCASVAMGHGFVRSAHGILPVPAPAALEVLREVGGVTADGGLARELCTPTGAAILAASVTSWTPAPTGRTIAIGYGAGDMELADRPNVVRLSVIDDGAASATTVYEIAANIDDMSGELCAAAAEAILAAGALDAWWTPVTMKKGRPALVLSALAEPAAKAAVIAAILRETTTIGVRFSARERTVLARRSIEVATPFGPISIKLALDGEIVRNAAPEYEACAAAARAANVPVKDVYAAAVAAATEALRTRR